MIYVVRHGQTDWNLEHKLQGSSDIPLNKKGIEQAEEVAVKLSNEPIDLIICSPLLRAKQTAEVINRNRNIPISFDSSISERDYGEYEGKNSADYNLADFWNYYSNSKYQGVENIKDFFKRVYDFLDRQAKEQQEKNILLVAHGGISIATYCYFNGIPENGEVLKLGLKNCEISKYKFQRNINLEER